MNSCRTSRSLLEAAVSGDPASPSDVEHATDCPQCARLLAQVRRFDAELLRATDELVTEPMAHYSADLAGRRNTMARRALTPVAAGLVLVAMIFGGGRWLGSLFQAGAPGFQAAQVDLGDWVEESLAIAIRDTNAASPPENWAAVQVELCGDHAIAFYAERNGGLEPYRWAIGQPGAADAELEVGVSPALTDTAVAQRRARLAVCELVVDPMDDAARAEEALEQAREVWADAEGVRSIRGPEDEMAMRQREIRELAGSDLAAMALLWPDGYAVLLERDDGVAKRLDRMEIRLEADRTFSLGQVVGAAGVTRPNAVYQEAAPPHDAYFALIDDPTIAAVDLAGRDVVLRYPAAAPGLLLQDGIPLDGLREYRFLDRSGRVVASGPIVGWPPER